MRDCRITCGGAAPSAAHAMQVLWQEGVGVGASGSRSSSRRGRSSGGSSGARDAGLRPHMHMHMYTCITMQVFDHAPDLSPRPRPRPNSNPLPSPFTAHHSPFTPTPTRSSTTRHLPVSRGSASSAPACQPLRVPLRARCRTRSRACGWVRRRACAWAGAWSCAAKGLASKYTGASSRRRVTRSPSPAAAQTWSPTAA
eukprot:scaffold6313_cov60-Phaeocystis_antarctica.AAC.1